MRASLSQARAALPGALTLSTVTASSTERAVFCLKVGPKIRTSRPVLSFPETPHYLSLNNQTREPTRRDVCVRGRGRLRKAAGGLQGQSSRACYSKRARAPQEVETMIKLSAAEWRLLFTSLTGRPPAPDPSCQGAPPELRNERHADPACMSAACVVWQWPRLERRRRRSQQSFCSLQAPTLLRRSLVCAAVPLHDELVSLVEAGTYAVRAPPARHGQNSVQPPRAARRPLECRRASHTSQAGMTYRVSYLAFAGRPAPPVRRRAFPSSVAIFQRLRGAKGVLR